MPTGVLGQHAQGSSPGATSAPDRRGAPLPSRRSSQGQHELHGHSPFTSRQGAVGKACWQWFIVIPCRSARPAGTRLYPRILNSNGAAVMRFSLKHDGMPRQRTPVPLQRWHLTTLSPFFRRPLPSQFLHFCFFLMFGPFSAFGHDRPRPNNFARSTMIQPRIPVYKHAPHLPVRTVRYDFRAGGRRMENRRHQACQRRRAMVDPRHVRRASLSADQAKACRRTRQPGRSRLRAVIADAWRGLDRSGASPAIIEARPAGPRPRRGWHARAAAYRRRHNRR